MVLSQIRSGYGSDSLCNLNLNRHVACVGISRVFYVTPALTFVTTVHRQESQTKPSIRLCHPEIFFTEAVHAMTPPLLSSEQQLLMRNEL